MCESFEKGCREHLSVSFTLKAWKDGKDGWGGQVEVNKEMAGMVREEMRAALCEDDLELSRGGGRGGKGVKGWEWRNRKRRGGKAGSRAME